MALGEPISLVLFWAPRHPQVVAITTQRGHLELLDASRDSLLGFR